MVNYRNILFKRSDSQTLVSDIEKKELDKLQNLALTTSTLFRAKTVFPFHLFPDEITIDPIKVSFIHRIFFGSEQLFSIEIKNILEVTVESGPFFATLFVDFLVVNSLTPPPPPIIINHLRKSDAAAARRIIQGLMIAKREGVNLTDVHTQNVTPLLQKVGKAS
ncbi:hypothetical protein A3D77_06515 [Candidatus Gottesmanbacteria bacterium RIFCSPHIGHO2_02_FULL_39_11]|uniref:YokE-like PH domain-containing protein n=1 Tax=Candidatus Gottesmanbacteria bacterium RIFCSPHIGHO2_02_FULL_39_11 TaxID=1798382 RepID=A0A1F5ZSZ7_9BACT|nr:MAG: hypothetical protein A3D77_06515 [Candidatus Gottesmanbacteria bacterium RIFCSPHIGHO2_02_FULL_39_11]